MTIQLPTSIKIVNNKKKKQNRTKIQKIANKQKNPIFLKKSAEIYFPFFQNT